MGLLCSLGLLGGIDCPAPKWKKMEYWMLFVTGPTMKLKRQVVTKVYEKEIDALYADTGGQ